MPRLNKSKMRSNILQWIMKKASPWVNAELKTRMMKMNHVTGRGRMRNNNQMEAIHRKQVIELKARLGNVALSDSTVSRICRNLFKTKFLGVFMQDSNIPQRNGYMVLNNDFVGGKGIHWLAVIKTGKNVYIYDSFGRLGRNILPHFCRNLQRHGYTIHNTDTSDQDQYGNKSVDCGHRCISALKIAHRYGINAFMQL